MVVKRITGGYQILWETSPRERERIEWLVEALKDKYAKASLHQNQTATSSEP